MSAAISEALDYGTAAINLATVRAFPPSLYLTWFCSLRATRVQQSLALYDIFLASGKRFLKLTCTGVGPAGGARRGGTGTAAKSEACGVETALP